MAIACRPSATRASAQRDQDTHVLYYDLIEAALGHAARKAFAMLPESYKFRGPTFKQGERKGKLEGLAEGKLEGLAEGKLEGQIEALFDVLDARAIPLSPATRSRIQTATDVDQVRRWLRRAAVIRSAEALFEE